MTTTNRLFPLVVLSALALVSEEQKSSLTILVVDALGKSIPARVQTFHLKGGSGEFASHFDGLKATAIPHGEYVFTLRRDAAAESSSQIWGSVSVERPEQTVVVIAEREPSPLSESYPPYSTTKFRLQPAPDVGVSPDPLRVRLSGLVSNDQEDALVDRSGEFRIHGWFHGPYILTVLRGSQVVAVQPILFHDQSRAETVVINLSSDAPAVLHVGLGRSGR
jgi:hypothetical protein